MPKTSGNAASAKPRSTATRFARLYRLEHRTERVLARHRFAARMGLAIGLWAALTIIGLAIGMTGYAYFEGMGAADAFVNAAMILSGMGPVDTLKHTSSKIFAGFYAILSGLIIVIATGFVLAPVFHRVLHRFHVEETEDKD